MTTKKLISREEILGGMRGRPIKQAHTLLTLIENRTAHLVFQSQRAMERLLPEEAAEERYLAFLEAIAVDVELPIQLTIQDLERYAPQWASLVAENPNVRAATADLLGQKYKFAYQTIPNLRAVLGLDEKAVQEAYQHLYNQPLETIFVTRTKLNDRLRWAWAALAEKLETLSPFWTAFSLTLTETVGAGILALPIALAGVGPLAGLVLLIVLGLANVLTIAATAEAVARNGNVRYGAAYFGRIVADYLGNIGSLILTLAMAILSASALLAYYIGFGAALADATGTPAQLWVAVLFLAGLYFLSRKSLSSTIASALVIGAINISLILLLSLLALIHVKWANLFYVNLPFLGGRPFEASILELIFGVVLMAYFGHTSAGNCAQVVLRRDSSARSLIWGTIAAQAVAIFLYCIWLVAVNGAIDPQILASESGTVLAPLAAQVGPSIHVFGSILVILSLGMASIHFSLSLFYLIRERLPKRSQPILILPRRRGRLLFRRPGLINRQGPRFSLTYLGFETNSPIRQAHELPNRGATPEPGLEKNHPQFRLDIQTDDKTYYQEFMVDRQWTASVLSNKFLEWGLEKHGIDITIEVLDADRESVRVQVTSRMRITYEGSWDAVGLSIADVFTLSDAQRRLVNWITREGEVSLTQVVAQTGQVESLARSTLAGLVEQGFISALEMDDELRYQTRLAPKRGRLLSADIRKALDKKFKAPTIQQSGPTVAAQSIVQRGGALVLGERGRFCLSASLGVLIFLLAEWLFLTGTESFTGVLSFTGTLSATLVGGIFPVLMLVASRRKGEFVPGLVLRFLGHPFFVTVLYLLFLSSLFLHGLVIWQNPMQRAAALAVGVMVLGATLIMVRRGAFSRRLVVELREDQRQSGQASFTITDSGQPATLEAQLGYPEGKQRMQAATGKVLAFSRLNYVNFQLAAAQAQELKVWAHRITPEGNSEGLVALATVDCGEDKKIFDLKLSAGQVVLPLSTKGCQLEIMLTE